MNEQKQEIINTRKGCLGGSDARMLMSIADIGSIPNSALKRLAICKGLKEPEQFTNAAMEFGNFIEECVFKSLHDTDDRWQSNPRIASEKYSRKNVKLYHHYLLGSEIAKKIGYKVKVVLCHYLTDGVDVANEREFDPSRLTVKVLRNMDKLSSQYKLAEAMDIVDKFLETFDSYYDGDEIPYELLPVSVKEQFDKATELLTEIMQREEIVDKFKEKLYEFLLEKNIKSIKNDAWTITRVDASSTKQFNSKKYLSDFAAKHPRKFKKLRDKYESVVNRKGYVKISIKK